MKYPKIRLVHNRRRTASNVKTASVELEINFDGERKRYATGVAVTLRQWSDDTHVVRHPDAAALNLRIDTFVNDIKSYINKQMIEGTPFSFDGLSLYMAGNKTGDPNVEEYIKEKISDRNDLREMTKRNHREILGILAEYGKFTTLGNLSPRLIMDFDNWLKGRGYKQTTVAAYHKTLKTYINIAIKEELIQVSPYRGIKIEKGKSASRKYLTDEELKAVSELQSEDSATVRARDLFLFQCYTGLAYVDLMKFDFTTAIQRNGKYVVRDIRQKSEEEYYIVLMAPAVEILEKYGYELPKISNQKYNAALKAVAAGAGIKFSLTTHCGRHTFATYCLNHGVSIETLAPMMGHSDIKTTQIYARMINKTVESAFEGLEQSLKN
nr:MAG TPA: SITE SPECIFIC RECOMBINASE XERD [Caudoviricetes sp.]